MPDQSYSYAQPFFHDHDRATHAVLILVFSFLACTAVSLRLWARRIQNLALSLSDYVVILGLVSTSDVIVTSVR